MSWWAPRTNDEFPNLSCWSDSPQFLNPGGLNPDIGNWPIILESKQGMAPQTGDNSSLYAHPWPNGWLVRAIRGEIIIATTAPQEPPDAVVGFMISMGILKDKVLDDAPIISSPETNGTCLDDWLWRRTIWVASQSIIAETSYSGSVHADIHLDKEAGCTDGCSYTGAIDIDDGEKGTPTILSASEYFGLPCQAVVPVRVKSKRRMRPEEHLTLIVEVSSEFEGDIGQVAVTPRLRAVVSKPV